MIAFDSLYKIQYGMYVITTVCGNLFNGQIATVLFQVTAEPPKIAICLSKNTYTHELILKSKVFGAAILSAEVPAKFIGTFGFKCGRNCNKFLDINYEINRTGCPLITDYALVVMEAAVTSSLDVGTHTIFVGDLISSKKVRDGVAMTYENYHTIRKGKSPENAPTYQAKPQEKS
jgi:ferric-chelate reductase [NAD(P)H]